MTELLCALGARGRISRKVIRRLCSEQKPETTLALCAQDLATEHWRQGRARAQALKMLDIHTVAPWDFPAGIKNLDAPPLALFVRGPAALLYADAEAIVGARLASPGPVWWARERSVDAVARGCAVVSGGAVGIDAEAHWAAWGSGGATVVVLGVPVDQVYPAEHRGLFAQLLRQGSAIVSEHPPMAKTYSAHHATRNRIIAGLSKRVWLAEAGRSSGALHTAKAALKLGIPIGVPAEEIAGSRDGIRWLLQQSEMVSVVGPKPL